jgi:collagenase-like PrtC family protease
MNTGWPGLPRRQPARAQGRRGRGADCVYLGLRDATNARNFAGLNFDEAAIANGIQYAHQRGRKVLMALNTYPQAAQPRALARRHGQGRRTWAWTP